MGRPKSNLYSLVRIAAVAPFHGFNTSWEALECVIPALSPVWPRTEGSARCRLIDPWKPDIVCCDRRVGEGVTRGSREVRKPRSIRATRKHYHGINVLILGMDNLVFDV